MRRVLARCGRSTGLAAFVCLGLSSLARAQITLAAPDGNSSSPKALGYPLQVYSSYPAPPGTASPLVLAGSGLYLRTSTDVLRMDVLTGGAVSLKRALGVDESATLASTGGLIYLLRGPGVRSESSAPPVIEALSTSTLQQVWKAQPWQAGGARTQAGPLVAGGNVLAASGSTLVLLRGDSGQILWSHDLGVPIGEGMAVQGATVVVNDLRGVEGLSLMDGMSLWTYPIAQEDYIPFRFPVLFQGRVYFPDPQGAVVSLDLATGSVVWRSPPLGMIDWRHPVLVSSSAVVAPLDVGLAGLSASGGLMWRKTFPFLGLRTTGPALSLFSDVIALAGTDGLHLVSVVDGSIVWEKTGMGDFVEVRPYGQGVVAVDLEGGARYLGP